MLLNILRKIRFNLRNAFEKVKEALIDAKRRFRTVEGLQVLEKVVVNNYFIPYESFDCYLNETIPSVKYLLKCWSTIIYCCIFLVIMIILLFSDGEKYWFMIGFPLYPFPKTKLLILLLICCITLGIWVRLSIIRMKSFECISIFNQLSDLNIRGKLNVRFYFKLCWQIELLANYVARWSTIWLTLAFFSSILSLIFYSYFYLDRQLS